MTQWETFTRLVKEGRSTDDIAATFGLPELAVKRILALGNLLPRVRDLYRDEKIDGVTVRHLTMASKSQQKAWLALFDDADPNAYVPTGHQLKAWLFGGASISTKVALFDLDSYAGSTIGNLFEKDCYFADTDQFWAAQEAAIEARKVAYLDAGWADVVIVPPGVYFEAWQHERAAKRKGGRVYVDVRASGEVTFHEGYVTRKEAARAARGEPLDTGKKPARPEVTSAMQTYIDLHRHAAVRAALTGHTSVALRLMVAHAIAGSHLWTVKTEPQSTRNEEVRESVETCAAETAFDERRRAVIDMLAGSPDDPTVSGGNGDDYSVVVLFRRLLALPDPAVLDVITIVMGETLASGSAAVEAAGLEKRAARMALSGRIPFAACGPQQFLFGGADRTQAPRGVGPNRQRRVADKTKIALDGEAKRQADAGDFGEAEWPKFGTAEAKIGQPEQRVAIAIKFGRQPSRRADRVEKFDHRARVGVGPLPLHRIMVRDGVGAQRRTQFGG